ncbi:Pleckstrin domain-containing family A member 5, partial [Stegodyphus mimosarum]
MSSSYRAKSIMNERPDVCPKTTQSSYSQNSNIQTSQSKSRKSREESMQRLLEWKQRMLQSPLSKRNHLQSNSSSDTSSPMNSPLRTGMQNQYQRQVRKELESHEAELRKYALSGHNKYSYSSPEPNSQPYASEVYRNYISGKQYQNQQVCDSKVPSFEYESQGDYYTISKPVQNNPKLNMNDSRICMTENICQENLMYCVDSENNEILFSYDDNSFNSCNISKTLQNSHYPPQMHSFSTMHNVSDIGNESQDLSTQDGCNSSEQLSVKDEYKKFNNSQEMLDTSNSSAVELQATAYSSDDEASLDSDGRFRSANSKVKYHGLSRASSSFESNVKEPNYVKKLVQQSEGLMCKGKRLSVSAGDLLGKTHEELVLLLIQLRRNQAKILRSKEKLEQQLENEQKLPQQSSLGQQLPSQNYKEIQLQIRQLENQYEVTQPLVTLVDNMVKLGSLYGSSHRRSFSLPLLDSSQDEPRHSAEVAQSPEHIGESSILSKLLTEENNLQKRISEIYSLDKGLRHETNSITSLHQDKKMLEHTLCGMQNKILDHQDKPGELQKLRKQQRMIEKELVRVKRLLSTSAKKIEDAASKNDQMEQEILLLRQILQQALKTGSSDLQASQHNRADLEAELTRLQNVLDELANHRHEINNTVEKLKSEARSSMSKGTEVRASPTGVAGSAPLPLRKKQHSTYLETDLDTMTTRDLAVIHEKDGDDIPVYANAEEINSTNEETCLKEVPSLNENVQQAHFSQGDSTEPKQCSMQDINDADERMKRFYGILPKEKPSEIKTVRIVKRQSERRNRERDKKRVTYDDQSSVWVVEEPDISSDDPLDAEEGNNKSTPLSHRPSSIYLFSSNTSRHTNTQSAHERLFGSSKKETSTENQDHVSSSRRSKRRHYTVSGYQYMLDPQFMQYFKDRPRSRDDVDMERCLRTANTPDIVRSTIKKKEVFDDKIIERELGLPQKIEIPERYVEVESEELSASEKLRRSLKAENICKMLSETTTTYEDVEERSKSPEALHKKLNEEKRKRAHLLSLNRALAREVVERSKAVAANVCSPENQASN